MDYYIITGVSRGIGEAIARNLLYKGNTLFCTSRTMNEDLVETASSLEVPLFYYEADLTHKGTAEKFMDEVFSRIIPDSSTRLALINNAGMLEPISRIENADPILMEEHLKLNLLAPALLSAGFIKHSGNLPIVKVILNISSGASAYPYAAWAMYCASKAGLNMLTRTIGLEQSSSLNTVKRIALAPGIVDTAMQTHIRKSDAEQFTEKEKFVKLHEECKLSEPASVAGIIIKAIFNPDIPQGEILTIDQMKSYSKEH
ncbi:MAG: SDR family NAD(P)-dependent oxidoreductase [Bacteroidales bacterium]|nr:SDR family NAD(P)-dependent oxidoreductase [Bacteroidales bacterium]